MNKNLIFRIIGALGAALMIIGVFVPYVSAAGYSASIFELYKEETIYLPIMIIIFGAVGVLVFAINKKTEFAYSSAGAIIFFLIMQTIDSIDQGVFKTLGIGYYCLCIGGIATLVMAFLSNLKVKVQPKTQELPESNIQPSVLNKINALYDEQPQEFNNITPIQPLTDNVIQPIPVQPIENQISPIEPIQPVNVEQPQMAQPLNNIVTQPVNQMTQGVSAPQPNPVMQEFSAPQPNPVMQEFSAPQPNPVMQEFSAPQPNPVMQEFNAPQPNPVMQEFNAPQPTPAMQEINIQPQNPVVQQFTNPNSSPSQSSNELDIFGQPINK